MAAKKGQTFAPLPARAIADDVLTTLDLRVLAALAVHDRLGANGTGCFASHTKLAKIVGCHLKSLSRSLRTLGERGYVEARQHPLMRTTRVYSVIYTDADLATVKRPIGNEPVTDEDARDGPKGTDFAPAHEPIGNRDFQEAEPHQRFSGAEVYSAKRGRYPDESVNDNSAAAAPRGGELPRTKEGRVDIDAAQLAQLDRWLKRLNGRDLTQDDMDHLLLHRDFCDEVEAKRAEDRDDVYFRAQRLASEITEVMEAWEPPF